MSELIVGLFDSELKAEEVRLDLMKKEGKHLVDLEDAVVVVRKESGKIKLRHMSHMTVSGAMSGGFLGSLMGVMLLNPVFAVAGAAAGAVVGAVSGSLAHAGVDEEFMHKVAERLKPGSSALCVLVTEHAEKVVEEIRAFHGKVFQTSLRHQDKERLQAVLDSVTAESASG